MAIKKKAKHLKSQPKTRKKSWQKRNEARESLQKAHAAKQDV